MFNYFNIEKCPKNEDEISFIFKSSNQVTQGLLNSDKPISIIRLGGSDYSFFIPEIIPMDKIDRIYELNGYFDKSKVKDDEIENIIKFRNLYIEGIKNSDQITIGGYDLIKKCGFIPCQQAEFSNPEKEFWDKYIDKNNPITHWDYVNLDYNDNFFLNIFPCLEGKRVCIISSFSEDIKYQVENNLQMIFKNNLKIYESFKYPNINFSYINVPICYNKFYKNRFNINSTFNDSLELLNDLFNKIKNTDSDIYLIGAGIYTIPLCDYIKKIGKKSIYIGSAIQLFFGILGNRFEYLKEQGVVNEYWKYPDLTKCALIVSKDKMGSFITDGINDYTLYENS
jgi:hypothetical protein